MKTLLLVFISVILVLTNIVRANINKVYGYNLSTGDEFLIAEDAGGPVIDDTTVVYNRGGYLYGYNLLTQEEFPISSQGGVQGGTIDGSTVVWAYNNPGIHDIYGFNINSNLEFPICTSSGIQSEPHISGNNVVYWDDRAYPQHRIYNYNLSTHEEFQVPTAGHPQQPAISDNVVVWAQYAGTNSDILGYNLMTEEEFPICTAGGYQAGPAISSDLVVWEDKRSGYRWDLYGSLLSTGEEFFITTGGGSAPAFSGKAVDGNFVVYSQEGNLFGYNVLTQEDFIIRHRVRSDEECIDYSSPSISGNIVVFSAHSYIIPEPATILLLTFGGLVLRKKRS